MVVSEAPKVKIKPMVRMTQNQIQDKVNWISNYIGSSNAASGSSVDANSNVKTKTIATMGAEIFKDFFIQTNRKLMVDKLQEVYPNSGLGIDYINYLESHILYKNDETNLGPYCVAINMWPFLEHGMTKLGGESKAPKHLESFCGSFINLVFAIASQFSGAVATAEFPLYFHYFAVKDYGPDYLKTHYDTVCAKLQHVVYSLNQPAASRGYQSVFWNLSFFDRDFYESMFGNFYFPDGTHIEYDSFNVFQKFFLNWLLGERQQSLLTFPVLTEASLNVKNPETGEMEAKDKEWAEFCAEIRSRGLSFFSYNDESAASLSSCCRLRNEIDSNDFSYSLGAGGVATGSTSVMTTNMSRLVQVAIYNHLFNKNQENKFEHVNKEQLCEMMEFTRKHREESIKIVHDFLVPFIKKVQKFQFAHRKIIEGFVEGGLLPAYTAGFITLDKQFCTLGVNGLNEAAEFMGFEVSNNDDYLNWVASILATYRDLNKEFKTITGLKLNTELIPAEGLGPRNSKWDKKDGLYNGDRICYNSYIYLPESTTTSIPDKFRMHGGVIADSLDGGSALHLALKNLPDKEFFLWLRNLAARFHTTYWTTNVKTSCCEDCGHIDMRTLDTCPVCGSKNLSMATRIIGYCTKISSWSEERQAEEKTRFYH